MRGFSFGSSDPSVRAALSGSPYQASTWVSDTCTRCRVAAAIFGTLRIALTAALQPGTATEAFSTDLAAASAVYRANAGATGAVSLSLAGRNFGAFASSPASRVGHTAAESSSWMQSGPLPCPGCQRNLWVSGLLM